MRRAPFRSLIPRARAALRAYGRAVWSRDRARLGRWQALGTRVLRVLFWTGRGISKHRLSLQAATLTYYTVFSIVPVLVVVLWILKAIDQIPSIDATLPAAATPESGNLLLRQAVNGFLRAVERTGRAGVGIVGFVALLYGVVRLFRHTEDALNLIAGSRQRAPRYSRILGYLAVFIVPAVLAAFWPLLARALPGHRLVAGALIGLAALWLALTLFYVASARAQIAFGSAAVGALVAALLLAGVLWAFAALQIGVAQASTLESGMAAFPVFLVWAFSSWYVVLLGAEVAVGHGVDRVLVHGAATDKLDAEGEQIAAVVIMARAARSEGGTFTADALARELRLFPGTVRALGIKLLKRGLITRVAGSQFTASERPDRVPVAAVQDALARDPALDPVRAALLGQLGPRGRAAVARALAPGPTGADPTVAEVAYEPDAPPATDQ